MNRFNTFNLMHSGHVSHFCWPHTAHAERAGTAARDAAGGGERICFMDNSCHVFSFDWLSGFLSF